MSKLGAWILSIIVGSFLFSPVLGYETNTEVFETISGSVLKVSKKDLSVTTYNWDNGETEVVDFNIDTKVKLINVSSLMEINEDDDIEIAYVIKDNKKIAKKIVVNPEFDGDDSIDTGDYGYENSDDHPEE